MKTLRKKGQGGEIIGFLVIVILIVVIIGIYVRFASIPEASGVSTSVADLQNDKMFNAMLEATVCESYNLEDVVKKCSKAQTVCQQDSCRLMEDTFDEMLDSLVGKRLMPELKQVYFYVEMDDEKVYEKGYEKLEEECLQQPNRKYMPNSYTIRPEIANLVIARCVI